MSATAGQLTRPLVLVVDDDPDLRTLAHIELADGFDVIQATDGLECLELAQSHSPDVILLDIMMSGMNGGEVLTALAAQPETRDIPVIFLSALAAATDPVRGFESGAIGYITKPFEPRELRARVGSAARIKAGHEELVESHAATDALTGLPTRAAFERRVSEEIYRSKRTHGPLSIAIIDIDQIDQVNDRFGRAAGDEILRTFADQLRKTMRMSDAVFRYGGDEFALVLADTNVSTAYLACERLRAALAAVRHDGHQVVVSVGIAELTPGRTTEELIAKGEIALFRAKESGGNQSWRSDDPRRRGLSPSSLSANLTEREWDVLTHLAHRRTEQEIGRRLGISAGTVRSHKARIRRKLHVPPEIRLGAFVKANLHDLVSRLGTIEDDGNVVEG